jgi:hypothetical protein
MNDINELVDLPDPAVHPLVHPLDLPQARRPYRTARLLRHRGHTRRRDLYALPGAVAVVASLGVAYGVLFGSAGPGRRPPCSGARRPCWRPGRPSASGSS